MRKCLMWKRICGERYLLWDFEHGMAVDDS